MFLNTSKISFFKKVAAKLKSPAINKFINDIVVKELELRLNINYYDNPEDKDENTDKNIIWFCWYQGLENAPVLVKKCYNQILINKPADYDVILITDENYKYYLNLPDYIIEKYHSGIISKAHFSDILRFSLLAEYGGLWADSTIFTLKNINFIENKAFFTLKNASYDPYTTISYGLWTGYFIGFNNVFYIPCFVRDCFYKYWETENKLFDYYFIDYAILLAYKKIPQFRNLIKELDYYGNNRFFLKNKLNEAINQADDLLLAADSVKIYKLSNKIKMKEFTENNKMTYYKKYIID